MTGAQALRSAVESLFSHKVRSGLTMLGMIFGVGAVIAMLAIGAGAERDAMEGIERLGLRNVLVRAKEFKQDELEEIRAKSLGVSPRDLEALLEAVPGVELAVGRVSIDPYKVLSSHGKTDARVHGVSAQHADMFHLDLQAGRFFDEQDLSDHAQVCVIGMGVRRELFGYGPVLGESLKVDDLWLEVIGVLEPAPGGGDAIEGVAAGSTTDEVYLPITTTVRKLERDPLESPYDEIIVRLTEGTSASSTAAAVSGLLDRLHGGQDDYELIVPEALLAQAQRTQRMFNIVMGCIAGISLLVGGIGIMNIMLATVLERTREIGVRRAVGATRSDIRTQFLWEAFAISAIGGVAGVAVGIAIAKVVAASAGWPTVVTVWSVLLSTGVSLFVGLSSGLYPAMQAAELDPIEALRIE